MRHLSFSKLHGFYKDGSSFLPEANKKNYVNDYLTVRLLESGLVTKLSRIEFNIF